MAQFFPHDKMFGYLIESELESLDKVLRSPQRPLTAIMGGAKVSTKITIIENLLDKVDNLILGGGMTFTFIKAKGVRSAVPSARMIFWKPHAVLRRPPKPKELTSSWPVTW